MAFTIGPGLLGILFLAGAIAAYVGNRFRRRTYAANPEEPWLWNPKWKNGAISGTTQKQVSAVVFYGFVLLLLTVSGSCFWWRVLWPSEAGLVGFAVVVLTAAGVMIVVGAVWFRKLRRFGTSVFKMAPFPGTIGGDVSGFIYVPWRVESTDGFLLTLTCTQMPVDSEEGPRMVWEAKRKLEREALGSSYGVSVIPVLFHVPYELPASDESVDRRPVEWTLDVKAETAAGPYTDTFVIPVFHTNHSSRNPVVDDSPIAPFVAVDQFATLCRGAGIMVDRSLDAGREYLFPSGWRRGGGLIRIAFAVVIAMLPLFGVIQFGLPSGVEKALIAVVGIALAITTVVFATLSSTRLRLTINRSLMTVTRSLWGISSQHVIAAKELDAFTIELESAPSPSQTYRIVAWTKRGKPITVGKNIEGLALAESVARKIQTSVEREL